MINKDMKCFISPALSFAILVLASPVLAQDNDTYIMNPSYTGHGSQLEGLNHYINGDNELSDICRELKVNQEETYMDYFCADAHYGIIVENDGALDCIEYNEKGYLVPFPPELVIDKSEIFAEELICAQNRATLFYELFLDYDYTIQACTNLQGYDCVNVTHSLNGDTVVTTFAFSSQPLP